MAETRLKMGASKRLLEEREHLEQVAAMLLKETGYLVPREFHGDFLANGDEQTLQAAYRLANARVTSGAILLKHGFKRRDLIDTIKTAADNAVGECSTCLKIAEE